MSRERRRPSNRSNPGGIALDQAQLGPKVTIAPWTFGPCEFKPDTGSDTSAVGVLSALVPFS